jgi:hypothetical protein
MSERRQDFSSEVVTRHPNGVVSSFNHLSPMLGVLPSIMLTIMVG